MFTSARPLVPPQAAAAPLGLVRTPTYDQGTVFLAPTPSIGTTCFLPRRRRNVVTLQGLLIASFGFGLPGRFVSRRKLQSCPPP